MSHYLSIFSFGYEIICHYLNIFSFGCDIICHYLSSFSLGKILLIYILLQLATQRFVNGEQINEDLYALASLPDLRLCIFSGCIVDGVRYHTVERESSRRTQNSGVMVEGSHNKEDIDFYGQLKEVLQLQYNSDASSQRTVVLFKCECVIGLIPVARSLG